MTTFLAKRLFAFLITLLVASLIIFLLLEILPGDPASIILGVGAQEDTLAALRTEMGLDLSAPERYFRWIFGILQGDFGRSYTYDTPVSELILERLSLSCLWPFWQFHFPLYWPFLLEFLQQQIISVSQIPE